MPVKRIAFDELLPDLPFAGEINGMAEAVNVLPLDSRWWLVQAPVLTAAGTAQVGGDGTAAQRPHVVGALYSHARDRVIIGVSERTGSPLTHFSSLREVAEPPSGGGDFPILSQAAIGGIYPGEIVEWSMCEFDDFFIATNGVNFVQYITAAATSFSDLFTSTLNPLAKYVCTSKVHLVLGWTVEGGVDFPRRIRWSAQGDPRDMDTGSGRAGFVDVNAANGEILALAGFEDYFLVWTEQKVLRYDYVGGEEVWHSVEIGSGPDAMATGMSRSVVQRAGGAMYRGRDGYKIVAGAEILSLGEGKIRSYVREVAAGTPLPGALDAVSGLVAWIGDFGFEAGSSVGTVLLFNPIENRWSNLDQLQAGGPINPSATFVVPVYAPNGASSDGIGNIMWVWYDPVDLQYEAHRLTSSTYVASRQKSRLVEPVPGGVSMVQRARPLLELEEGSGKTVPTIQVKVEGWNDLYKKTAGFTAVTLDTDTDLNTEGWMVAPPGLSANRWELTVIVPEIDSSAEYVPINLLGLDVEFDQFSER